MLCVLVILFRVQVAMHRDKFPEKIPFRLTRMLMNAMEVRACASCAFQSCGLYAWCCSGGAACDAMVVPARTLGDAESAGQGTVRTACIHATANENVTRLCLYGARCTMARGARRR